MVSPPMMQGTGWPSTAAMPRHDRLQRRQFHAAKHGRREQRRAGRRLEERHVDPVPLDLLGKGHLARRPGASVRAATPSGLGRHVAQQVLEAHQVAGDRERPAHRHADLGLGELAGQPGGHAEWPWESARRGGDPAAATASARRPTGRSAGRWPECRAARVARPRRRRPRPPGCRCRCPA